MGCWEDSEWGGGCWGGMEAPGNEVSVYFHRQGATGWA